MDTAVLSSIIVSARKHMKTTKGSPGIPLDEKNLVPWIDGHNASRQAGCSSSGSCGVVWLRG